MGILKKFDLASYGCNVYVETGTGVCNTLSKAIPNFEKCYSVDLDENRYKEAKAKFPQANLYHGLSIDALEHWLKNDIQEYDRVLFFLDAHFPDADYNGAQYDVEAPNAVPLQQELELIRKYRPHGKDFIICDDLRIYADGDFEDGDCPGIKVKGGLSFLYKLYKNITLDYSEHGYIMIDCRHD